MTTSAAPVLWFSAPALTANLPNPAGQQFMSLFNDPSAWQVTAGATAGMVLSESFILLATDQQLSQIFAFLKVIAHLG